MIPDSSKVVIDNNETLVLQFLNELIIQPRHTIRGWSSITNQTPAVKLGYIGQHLASLLTGVKGTGSGARGDDLADHTEVKCCNKVDQADKCLDCDGRVMRFQDTCPNCGSTNIERKEDSKWLFSIRSEAELDQYKNLDRVLMILFDYPRFNEDIYTDIRISAFEIYPKNPRMQVFNTLIDNHYHHIFLPKLDANKKTNPMNLHPFGIQFYKCNPIKTFECIITDVDTAPVITINKFISPSADRTNLSSELMPACKLSRAEWNGLDFDTDIKPLLKTNTITEKQFRKYSLKRIDEICNPINEELRNKIPLRDIVSVTQSEVYDRSHSTH